MEIYRPEEQNVDGIIILKRSSNKWAGMAWNELIWMGTGTIGRFCDGGKEHQGS